MYGMQPRERLSVRLPGKEREDPSPEIVAMQPCYTTDASV